MTEIDAFALILGAKTPQALFPVGEDATKLYRQLARLCHPDVASHNKQAVYVFQKLTEFHNAATGKTPTNLPIVAGYVIERTIGKGDLCDVYACSSKDYSSAVFKIASKASDNDLVLAEASALKKLYEDKITGADTYQVYLPKLLQSFKASGRQANILNLIDGHYSLAELKAIFPAGIDFRHTVWQMNRLLSVLGYAHRHGIVHGAILPDHLLYRPDSHGLVLIDWCYSVEIGNPLVARVKRHANDYAPEVARKFPAMAGLDIYMAVKAVTSLAERIPRRFRALLEHCLAESPSARPQDAWEVQDKWVALAREEFGSPNFLEFKIPAH